VKRRKKEFQPPWVDYGDVVIAPVAEEGHVETAAVKS
jgi:hypothetical protein